MTPQCRPPHRALRAAPASLERQKRLPFSVGTLLQADQSMHHGVNATPRFVFFQAFDGKYDVSHQLLLRVRIHVAAGYTASSERQVVRYARPSKVLLYEIIPEMFCACLRVRRCRRYYVPGISHQLLLSFLGVVQDSLPRHLLGDRLHPAEVHVSRRFSATAAAASLRHLSPISSSPTYATCPVCLLGLLVLVLLLIKIPNFKIDVTLMHARSTRSAPCAPPTSTQPRRDSGRARQLKAIRGVRDRGQG